MPASTLSGPERDPKVPLGVGDKVLKRLNFSVRPGIGWQHFRGALQYLGDA